MAAVAWRRRRAGHRLRSRRAGAGRHGAGRGRRRRSMSSRAFRTPCRRRARCAGSPRRRQRRGRARATATHSASCACSPRRSRPASTRGIRAPMSEDCLTLNIWAPAGARKAPVFVWIHGGALADGWAAMRVRRRQARGARRGRRLDQLSPRRARFSRASAVERGVERRRVRQLRTARPDRGPALGHATSPRSAAIPRTSRSRASRPAG